MTVHVLDAMRRQMVAQILICCRPSRQQSFRAYLMGSPFARLRQITEKLLPE